jgi:serine/threonine protein kinase
MSLHAGTRLGPYEVLSPLGAGGMGEVYLAKDSKLRRDVAIKVLPPSLAANGEALARFEREALAVASLSHPNILSIFDFGMEDGVSYAVSTPVRSPRRRPWTMQCSWPGGLRPPTRRGSSTGT